jgi:uncharacterized membrane protein
MALDTRQLATGLLFFVGVALSMWRWPQGDRWHRLLCAAAALLWCALPVVEPTTRTPAYGFVVLGFLWISVSRSRFSTRGSIARERDSR